MVFDLETVTRKETQEAELRIYLSSFIILYFIFIALRTMKF